MYRTCLLLLSVVLFLSCVSVPKDNGGNFSSTNPSQHSISNLARISITNSFNHDISVYLKVTNQSQTVSHKYKIGDINKDENGNEEPKNSLIPSGKIEKYIIPSSLLYTIEIRDKDDNNLLEPIDSENDYSFSLLIDSDGEPTPIKNDYAYYFSFNGSDLIRIDARPLVEIGQPDPVFVKFTENELSEAEQRGIIQALDDGMKKNNIPLNPLFPEEYASYEGQVTNTIQVSLKIKERTSKVLYYTDLSLTFMQDDKKIDSIDIPLGNDYLIDYDFFEKERQQQFWSLGISVGTSSFIQDPLLIGTVQGTISPWRHLFFRIGLDVGLLSNEPDLKSWSSYYSLFPFAHFNVFVPFLEKTKVKTNWYFGAGGGLMYAEYNYTGGEKINYPLFEYPFADFTTGFIFFDLIDLSYTYRTNFNGLERHKLSIGFIYRFRKGEK